MLPFFMHADGFILSEDDLKRYNGHHTIDKYYFSQDSHQPTIETVNPNADLDLEDLKQWLRPTRISQEDVERWKAVPALKILLIKTQNEFTRNPAEYKPSHRTIPGQTEVTPLPGKDEHIQMIKEIFHHARLPLAAVGAYLKSHITFLNAPTYEVFGEEGNSGGLVTKYYCPGTSWSIAWSYFHETRHTSAVMFYREGDGCKRRNELEHEIIRLREHIAHPLLLAYIKTQISLCWTFQLLEQMNGQTFEIERSVGLATWDWCLDRELEAYQDPDNTDPESEEAIARAQKRAVERYNVLSGKLINIRFRLRAFKEQINWIRRMNKIYLDSLALSDDTINSSHLRTKECNELDTILDRMDDFTKVYLHDADNLLERLMQQMSSLSHLVTQRDSRISLAIADINNELAWQGKNTNNAMMAIAVASFVFLPGTFIASVFDTPIFNWQPQTSNNTIVSQPFWIYWLTCGLTTGALCVCWSWYMKRKRAFDSAKRQEARENFRRRILRTPTLTKIGLISRTRSRSKRGGASAGEASQGEARPWFRSWLWRTRIRGAGSLSADEERGAKSNTVEYGLEPDVGLGAAKAASLDGTAS